MDKTVELELDHQGDRVRHHSSVVANDRIDAQTMHGFETSVRQGRGSIVRRLTQLEKEWDIDRALMVNFAIAGGVAFLIGMRRYTTSGLLSRKRKGFLYLFGAQLGFLLLHGIVGWCPPVPVFRRLGFRTSREIEGERRALEQVLGA